MLAVALVLILGFGLFCVYGSDDMLSKTEYSLYAWCIALFMLFCCVGCVFWLYEAASYDALIKYEKNELILEKQIQVDTSYLIKKLK